jgi:WD40 repeat protein
VDLDRAEAIVKQLLSPKYLNPPQEMVFRSAWQGQSYRDLARVAGYDPNYIKGVGAQVWRLLSAATQQNVTKANFQQILLSLAAGEVTPTPSSIGTSNLPTSPRLEIDWSEAIDVSAFYGRELECTQLHRWMTTDRCRLVAILGMGGMGKTTISIEILRQLQAKLADNNSNYPDQFSQIVWRSLLNAPPLSELLPELIRTLVTPLIGSRERHHRSAKPPISSAQNRNFQLKLMPQTVGGQIELLLEICQQQRCLIVLDHGESILQSGAYVGKYRTGYEDYGDLFTTLGQMNHQSCLLLTSREKPAEISKLAGVNTKVRTLVLPGLDHVAGKQIFADRGCLPVPLNEWAEIDRYCGGNPLALQLIAATVQEVADGDINEILPYLRSHQLGFADIHVLLDQQWQRLTMAEQQVMHWLAIGREPMSIIELEQLLHPAWNHQPPSDDQFAANTQQSSPHSSLLTVLQSLCRRSIFAAKSSQINGSRRQWSLPPMMIEYVTSKFVDHICTEIEQHRPVWLNTHPICQVNTKEYLRQAQLRTIVQPAVDRLRTNIGNLSQIGIQLRSILAQWRITNGHQPGYLAGNILNFLTYLQLDLTDLDCSDLFIQQAYLVGSSLPQVNFANTHITNCAFTQAFSSILAIAFSPDGHLLAASDSSGEIRLWCVQNQQCLMTCSGHSNWVRAIAFSPDGRYLASSSDDRTLKIWDVQTGSCVRTIGAGIHSFGLSFSPDGRYLASSSANHLIYYWDWQTGACVREFAGHQDWSIAVKFDPHGHKLISASADRTVRVWDLASGDCELILAGHDHWVTTIDCSADGQTILSGSLDGSLRLWDLAGLRAGAAAAKLSPTLERCQLVVTGHGDEIWSAAFSPDGTCFASAGMGGLLRIWQTSDGACRQTLAGHSKRLWSVAFHPQGDWLASGGEDQTIRWWQVDNGSCLQVLNGHTNWFRSIAWSADQQRVITASHDAQVRVWPIDSVNLGQSDSCQSLSGHLQSTMIIAVDPQGLTFASGSDDLTIKIWDARSLTCLQTLRGHTDSILALVYSADGQYLVSAGHDQTIRSWDTQRWRCLSIRTGHTARIGGLAYHPQLDLIASASEDQTIRIWNLHDREPIKVLTSPTHRPTSVAFDLGGKLIASGGLDHQISIWNIETGTIYQTLTGHTGWILSLAYSPDGQWLFSGSTDDTIKVWSIATGLCVNTLVSHQNWVWSVTVSSCGTWLASASEDETIKIWNLADSTVVSTHRVGRPYERLNIAGINGLTTAQLDGLRLLGAKG